MLQGKASVLKGIAKS